MANKPLTLSIVIPVYNEQIYLRSCLDSIAAQTVKVDEVIVVDNNSTDKSAAIAKSYKFVKLLHQPQQGIVYTRNKGFDAVKSDIIGRIDADTVLPADWAERVKHFYEQPGNDRKSLTGGGYFYNVALPRFNGWGLGQVMYRVNRFILGHYNLWGSNMALPRSLWEDVRGSTCTRDDIHEDLDLSIHLHRLGYAIAYVENLRVGVEMKRLFTRHDELWSRLLVWPQTAKVHGMETWVIGWFGAVVCYAGSPLLIFMNKVRDWYRR